MEAPIIAMLRLMWRLRGMLAIVFLIVLGHIWLNDAIRAWDNWHKPSTATTRTRFHLFQQISAAA